MLRRRVASIGVVGVTGECLLVDATPDFAAQIAALGDAAGRDGPDLDAIVLTHAHIGHYLGLALLGREAVASDHLPVHATSSMARFLRGNRPWSYLVTRGEIELMPFRPGEPLVFDGVTIHAFLVPHRAEDTDTIALEIRGPNRTLVYVPDTDVFEPSLVERICDSDIALMDGTFYSRDELRHREILEVRHPIISESLGLFGAAEGELWFTHLNHTNALLHPTRAPTLPARFGVALDGQSFGI